MVEWILSWPTWQLTRILGIMAYLALFAGMALGMLYGYPFAKGTLKARLYCWHTRLTGFGTVAALLHAAVLIVDTYSPFTWSELLIPFTAHDQPFWYGMGTLSAYGMLALLLSSDLRPKLKRPIWLAIHMLSYPIFLMALFHGIQAGTDTAQPWAQAMYSLTLIITLLLAGGRMLLRVQTRPRSGSQTRTVREEAPSAAGARRS